MEENEVYIICQRVDPFIASELTESIMTGISYDMLPIMASSRSAGLTSIVEKESPVEL